MDPSGNGGWGDSQQAAIAAIMAGVNRLAASGFPGATIRNTFKPEGVST